MGVKLFLLGQVEVRTPPMTATCLRGLHLVKDRVPGYTSYQQCGAGCEPCPVKARKGVKYGLLRNGFLGKDN